MKNKLSELWYFTKLLSKKWVLWVSFVIGIIMIVLDFLFSTNNIPSYVYWIVFLIGLFWSSYQVFQDTSEKIPKNLNILITPKLAINFIEGNEYDYDIRENEYSDENNILPWYLLKLNLRIENIGEIDFDILTIISECLGQETKEIYSLNCEKVGPLRIMGSDKILRDSEELKFPVHLEPVQTLLCEIVIPIQPDSLLTSAQIASRFHALQSSSTNFSNIKVIVEVVDNKNKGFKFDNMIKVSFRPLWDFYVNHWLKLREADLVRLAGGTYLPNNENPSELPIITD